MLSISTEALWQFSLAVYPQRQDELLHWQDAHEANVNLALLCLYLDRRAVALSSEQIAALNRLVQIFSSTHTAQIRKCRRHMKEHKAALIQYKQIRERLLQAEMLLEQQEQRLLLDFFNQNIASISTAQGDNNWFQYQQLLLSSNQD